MLILPTKNFQKLNSVTKNNTEKKVSAKGTRQTIFIYLILQAFQNTVIEELQLRQNIRKFIALIVFFFHLQPFSYPESVFINITLY